MPGRVALVTGATSGLGYATAAELGKRGDTVLVHGRTQLKAEQAVQRLSKVTGAGAGQYIAVYAELGSLDEVRQLAAQARDLSPGGLDVLINNAGAQFNHRRLSADGIEMTTAVVHVAAAALSRLLLDHLRRAGGSAHALAQVITVTSLNERMGRLVTDWSYATGYRQVRAYSNAKLMALAYTYALARRVDEQEVTFGAADPGIVFTDFGKKAGGFAGLSDRVLRPVAPLLIASPEKAARRSVLLAVDAAAAEGTGRFYAKGGLRMSSKRSRDPAVMEQVYEVTEERLSSAGI
ncbi:MAG TPA: SDR family NAD(P)-dependent oxidoreductase [Trebonia sp.]|nr:SDR family NAD(P)-dependent oxidoreductase [Trebonia sp.]